MEASAQQVDRVIERGMKCVTLNIMRKLLHSRWTVLL